MSPQEGQFWVGGNNNRRTVVKISGDLLYVVDHLGFPKWVTLRQWKKWVSNYSASPVDSVPDSCPFCGRDPEVGPEDPSVGGNGWGYVACRNSECAAQPSVEDRDALPDESLPHKQAAIEKWNRRTK